MKVISILLAKESKSRLRLASGKKGGLHVTMAETFRWRGLGNAVNYGGPSYR